MIAAILKQQLPTQHHSGRRADETAGNSPEQARMNSTKSTF